jgi:hypothetical protein
MTTHRSPTMAGEARFGRHVAQPRQDRRFSCGHSTCVRSSSAPPTSADAVVPICRSAWRTDARMRRAGVWEYPAGMALRVGFALLLVGFAALAPLTAAGLGGSSAVIAGSLPVAWAAGFLGVQVVARISPDIAAVRELGPAAALASPLGGLIVCGVGILLATAGVQF